MKFFAAILITVLSCAAHAEGYLIASCYNLKAYIKLNTARDIVSGKRIPRLYESDDETLRQMWFKSTQFSFTDNNSKRHTWDGTLIITGGSLFSGKYYLFQSLDKKAVAHVDTVANTVTLELNGNTIANYQSSCNLGYD